MSIENILRLIGGACAVVMYVGIGVRYFCFKKQPTNFEVFITLWLWILVRN